MKKFLIITGGIGLFFFIAMFCICWWAIDALTLEKGRSKTAAARERRWVNNGKHEDEEIPNSEPLKENPDEKAQ